MEEAVPLRKNTTSLLRFTAWFLWLRRKVEGDVLLTLIGALTLVVPFVSVAAHANRDGVINHWVEEGVPFELSAAVLIVATLWRVCNTYDLRDAWAFARSGPVPFWILFIAWATMTCWLSSYKGFAIHGLVQATSFLLIPALVAYKVRRGIQMRTLLSVFCAAVILAALQGIIVLLQAESGTRVHPAKIHGLFGAVLVLPLMLVLSISSHGRLRRVLARTATFLGVVAMLVAYKWICWLGMSVSCAVMCLLLARSGLVEAFIQGRKMESARPFRALEQDWIDHRPAQDERARMSGSGVVRNQHSDGSRLSHRSDSDSSLRSGRGRALVKPVQPTGKRRAGLLYKVLHTLTVLAAFVLFLCLTNTLSPAVLIIRHATAVVDLVPLRMQQYWTGSMLALNSRQHTLLHSNLSGLSRWGGNLRLGFNQYWRGPASMVGARPVSGWGIGCYALYQMQYTHIGRSAIIVNGFGPLPEEQARNLYIKISAELGLPGLALWVGALATTFVVGLRRLRFPHPDPLQVRVLIGGLAVLSGQAVDVFTDPAWMFGRASIFSALVMGITLAASGVTEDFPTVTVPTNPENGHWLMTTHRGRYLRFVAACFIFTVLLALLVEAIIH